MGIANILSAINLGRIETRTVVLNSIGAVVESVSDRELVCIAPEEIPETIKVKVYIPSSKENGEAGISGTYYFDGKVSAQEKNANQYKVFISITTPDESVFSRKSNRIRVHNMALRYQFDPGESPQSLPIWDISKNGLSGISTQFLPIDAKILVTGLEPYIPKITRPLSYQCKAKIKDNLWGFLLLETDPEIVTAISDFLTDLELVARFFDLLLLSANILSHDQPQVEGQMSIEFIDRQLMRKSHVLKALMDIEEYQKFVETLIGQSDYLRLETEWEALSARLVNMRIKIPENKASIIAYLEKVSPLKGMA